LCITVSILTCSNAFINCPIITDTSKAFENHLNHKFHPDYKIHVFVSCILTADGNKRETECTSTPFINGERSRRRVVGEKCKDSLGGIQNWILK
jgi:hypothetical protein